MPNNWTAEWKNKLVQGGTVTLDLMLTPTAVIQNRQFPESTVTEDFLQAEAMRAIEQIGEEDSALKAVAARGQQAEAELRLLVEASEAGMALIQARAATDEAFWTWAVDGLTDFRQAVLRAKNLIS